MTLIHGFELVDEQTILELNTKGQLYRHVKSGASLLSLQNDDENKVFGATFRTPPSDSTGLPHIMEHSVLCGSRKYPLKEPFVELVKGSLKTFVNAMTYSDKTVYPLASQNLQDFYNLIDVYLDAVFHPLIQPHHLQQEGWHYELDSLDAQLNYRGVVYNEMKGAYSSPDNVLARYTQQAIFPDNTYGVDSGGNPKIIPDLSYEQFKHFHETYYHPSNAYLYFYGDDDPMERLRLLDVYLCEFDAITVDSSIPLQSPFAEPRQVCFQYGVDSQTDSDAPKAYVDINWMLSENDDPTKLMGLRILSRILLGTQAAPLRKTLLDSGLGEDVLSGGLYSGLRQMVFSVGMKGVHPDETGKVEMLALNTLEQLAEEGFPDEMVEAAVNSIEFAMRENNTGSAPRGLSLMIRSFNTWLYDRDPFSSLTYDAPLAEIKSLLASNPTYLQDLLRTNLLDNTHRASVVLEPDPALHQRNEAEEKAKLAKIQAEMDTEQLQAIIENTEALKTLQETPDSPELLATLPRLSLSDLPKTNKPIPIEVLPVTGASTSQILLHDLATNGVVYLDIAFNLHRLSSDLLPYIRLFGTALTQMGTATEDFVTLSQRIGRKTGGIWTALHTSANPEDAPSTLPNTNAWFIVRGKSTLAQTTELLDILRDILLTVNLDNSERFRQLVLQAKARAESALIPRGHGVVSTRLNAYFTEMGWLDEELYGVEYLFFLRQLASEIDKDWPSVLAKLDTIRTALISRDGLVCNVTVDAAGWAQVESEITGFIHAMPETPTSQSLHNTWMSQFMPMNEGLTIPAQVNYVGKGANLYALGYEAHGSVNVINNFVRNAYLWEKVRAQGGAYGCYCNFSRRTGVYTFTSYRDPNLLNTLNAYDEAATFLRNLDLSHDELTKSIIGVIGKIDTYRLPDAKGYVSMIWHLQQSSDDERQLQREQVLSTTAADFNAFADVLGQVRDAGQVVVLGSGAAIEAANGERQWLTVQKVM
ncbi:MAG: insulinase family protein [Chloroflexota bacterium]